MLPFPLDAIDVLESERHERGSAELRDERSATMDGRDLVPLTTTCAFREDTDELPVLRKRAARLTVDISAVSRLTGNAPTRAKKKPKKPPATSKRLSRAIKRVQRLGHEAKNIMTTSI